MGLPGQETNVTISLAVWIHYMNVTDRQTDRHRQTDRETERQMDRQTDRQTPADSKDHT